MEGTQPHVGCRGEEENNGGTGERGGREGREGGGEGREREDEGRKWRRERERLTLRAEVLVDSVEEPQFLQYVVLSLHGLLQVHQEQHPEGIDVFGEDT